MTIYFRYTVRQCELQIKANKKCFISALWCPLLYAYKWRPFEPFFDALNRLLRDVNNSPVLPSPPSKTIWSVRKWETNWSRIVDFIALYGQKKLPFTKCRISFVQKCLIKCAQLWIWSYSRPYRGLYWVLVVVYYSSEKSLSFAQQDSISFKE